MKVCSFSNHYYSAVTDTCNFISRAGKSFWSLHAQHLGLKKKRVHKVPVSRGLNCTYEMAISYTHDLANEPIDAGIAANMKQIQNEQ